MWIGYVGNRKPIEAIYSIEPPLRDVRVIEIVLHEDGPRLSVRIDINQFPDKPPKKWLDRRFNRAQLTLMFIEIHELVIRGWSVDNIVSILIHPENGSMTVTMKGRGTEIFGRFGFIEIEKISGYHDTTV